MIQTIVHQIINGKSWSSNTREEHSIRFLIGFNKVLLLLKYFPCKFEILISVIEGFLIQGEGVLVFLRYFPDMCLCAGHAAEILRTFLRQFADMSRTCPPEVSDRGSWGMGGSQPRDPRRPKSNPMNRLKKQLFEKQIS